MENQAVYISAQRELVVAFQDVESYDDKNRPKMRKSAFFKEGELVLDLTTEKGKLYEKLLDAHPQNVLHNGSINNGFKKQKNDLLRAQMLSNGEVYCATPADGITEADLEALVYLKKMAKVMPPTALKNTITRSIYIYERFDFAGIPKPSEGLEVAIAKARVTEMMWALKKQQVWSPDDTTEGKATAGSTAEDD